MMVGCDHNDYSIEKIQMHIIVRCIIYNVECIYLNIIYFNYFIVYLVFFAFLHGFFYKFLHRPSITPLQTPGGPQTPVSKPLA